MPKKIQNTTKATLISVPLPNHAATYTVISHQFVIDYAFQSLAAAGFGIVEEEYRCTADGQIAQGIYKLNFNSDPELSMMFAWTNSYNKQVKFKCVVGAYMNETGSVMISGSIGNWVRKHTGTADTEVKDTIDQYVSNAHMYYTQLCSDKVSMEAIILNKRRQAQLLGVLFAEYEILTTEQASIIREQMKKPKQVFANTDSLWAFYNFVTNALQYSHPRTWLEDQRILHYFIGTICNLSAPVQPVSAPVEEVDPLYVIPNQTNILDQIADLEADEIDEDIRYAENDDTYDDTSDENDDTSIEVPDNQVVQEDPEMLEIVHQVEEIFESLDEAEETPFDLDAEDDAVLDLLLTPLSPIEFKAENPNLETGDHVKYSDPAGNTFEAPIVTDDFATEDNFEEANFDTLEVEEEVTETDDDADFDLDFTSNDTEEDKDDIPDFF